MREMNEQQNAVVILDDYSVIVAEKEALQAFFSDGKNLGELYGQVEKMARGLVADTSTKEGIAQIKTAARQLASVRTKVDDIIAERLQGFTESGYELAAREIVKAVLNGKINNLKVEY